MKSSILLVPLIFFAINSVSATNDDSECESCKPPILLGGLGEIKPASPKVDRLVQPLSAIVAEKVGCKIDKLTPIEYRSQVVAGMIYYVKVKFDGKGCKDKNTVHLKILEPLGSGNNVKLLATRTDIDEQTPLEYF